MRTDRTPLRPSRALLTLCLASLAACASSSLTKRQAVEDMVVRGKFAEAVHAAAKLREKHPEDEDVLDLHKQASVAMLLELGRRANFDHRNEEALAHFEKAARISPDSQVVLDWYDKTLRQLGESWYLRARDEHLAEELETALKSYDMAIEYLPDHLGATEGKGRALLQMNYRAGLSKDYYNDGVRALHDYMLQISRTRFGYALKYRPDDDRSIRRAEQVDRLRARRRLSIATSLEEDAKFAAANKEYQLALLLDEELEEAVLGRDRTKIETVASRMADRAAMMVLRHEWEKARELLEEGLAHTKEQKDRFQQLISTIDDSRAQVAYDLALDLEHDYRYEAAILAYGELLAEREWFEDSRARMGTLEEYVKLASTLYEDAANAPSEARELLALRQIELFWAEYKDIQARIVDLEARVGDEARALQDADFAEGAGVPEDEDEEASSAQAGGSVEGGESSDGGEAGEAEEEGKPVKEEPDSADPDAEEAGGDGEETGSDGEEPEGPGRQ